MKRIVKIIFVFLLVFLINSKVGAVQTRVLCKIKLPMEQGISENRYLFKIEERRGDYTFKENNGIFYEIRYESQILYGGKLANIFQTGKVVNLGEKSGLTNYYRSENLISSLSSGHCPKYAWIGPKSGYAPNSVGIILSNEPVKQSSIGGYYNIYADNQESTMTDQEYIDKKIKEYNELYLKLDDLIVGSVAKKCSRLEENLDNLDSFNDIFDNSSLYEYIDQAKGEDLRKRLETALRYCRTDGYEYEGETNLGEALTGCEVIPESIRKWINNILKMVRYVALAITVALGTLDFIKAAASGEPDSMKKAGQSFIKRLIAVIILFLLPLIVDFILNMVNIYGVDPNNINCMNTTSGT